MSEGVSPHFGAVSPRWAAPPAGYAASISSAELFFTESTVSDRALIILFSIERSFAQNGINPHRNARRMF